MTVVDVVKKTYVDAQDKKLGLPVVIDTADRTVQFPVPLLNQYVRNLSTGDIERYNGTVWETSFEGVAGFKTRYNTKAIGMLGDSATDDYTKFNTLVNVTMQPGGGTVEVVGVPRIASDVTVPANITLKFLAGAYFSVDLTKTMTIVGAIRAPAVKIFGGGGRYKFDNNYTLKALYGEYWGAKADCTGFGLGTDSTLGIQSAIDAVTLGGARCIVKALGGGYRTEDTIHLGYGTTFAKVTYIGQGSAYAGVPFQGTAIYPSKTDRLAFNFQGGRNSRVKKMAVLGKLSTYVDAQALGMLAGALVDDTLAASWNDPALGGALLDGRYNPYGAFGVDAYAGVRPGVSYPDVVYPAYMGVVAQYGKAFSSDCQVDDVYISGFTVALVNQPCDADGNGDFTKLLKSTVVKCKWVVSVGNTQSRNVEINNLTFSQVYAVITNNKHGKQLGRFGGPFINMTGGASIKLFEIGSMSIAGPLKFVNGYTEAMWQIGTMNAASAAELSIEFDRCLFDFSNQNDVRGYPAYLLQNTGAGSPDISFSGSHFSNYKSIAQISSLGVRFDGLSLAPASARANPYEKQAHNALMGGLVTDRLITPSRCRVRTNTPFNVDTAAALPQQWTDRYTLTNRPSCIPFYCESFGTQAGNYDKLPMHFRIAQAFAKATLAGLALAGPTLTITFAAARSAYQFMQHGPLPGDVVWDDQTGTVFFVRSRIGDVVLAEIQNNYKVVAGVVTPIVAFSAAVGNLYWRNSRIYTPKYMLRGDTTAANAVIANVARDDGFAAWFDADIVAGDYFLIDEEKDNWMGAGTSLIAAESQAAGTITVTGAGMRATEIRRRLLLFVRQPVANV